MLVTRETLLELLHFLPTSHVLGVMNHLVQQLLLGHFGFLRLRARLVREECLHQVLVRPIQKRDVQVDHVIVLDANL